MRNFQKKGRLRRVMQSKPVLILLGILALAFAWNVVSLFDKMLDTVKNRKIVEKRMEQLQREKENLSMDIQNLKTEKGREESIREKFGLVKEGEGLIVVVEDENQQKNKNNQNEKEFILFFKNLFK